MRTVFLKKGPVIVDGELLFTLKRDVFSGDPMMGSNVVMPDGTTPEGCSIVPHIIAKVMCGELRPDP